MPYHFTHKQCCFCAKKPFPGSVCVLVMLETLPTKETKTKEHSNTVLISHCVDLGKVSHAFVFVFVPQSMGLSLIHI